MRTYIKDSAQLLNTDISSTADDDHSFALEAIRLFEESTDAAACGTFHDLKNEQDKKTFKEGHSDQGYQKIAKCEIVQ